MKNKLIKIFRLMLWATACIGFLIMAVGAIQKQRNLLAKGPIVKLDTRQNLYFVDEQDIESTVMEMVGDSLQNKPLNEIKLSMLEAAIERNPFVDDAEVFSNIRGVIHIEVKQREPLIRVINKDRVSFYIDNYGELMPTSNKFTPRVPVATGYIGVGQGETIDSAIIRDLFLFAKHIGQSEFWKAQFEQVYVREDGEFELIPKLEDHIVLIGDMDELEKKLKKLMIFYQEVLKNVDGSQYRMVNLKFEDRIICSKI